MKNKNMKNISAGMCPAYSDVSNIGLSTAADFKL